MALQPGMTNVSAANLGQVAQNMVNQDRAEAEAERRKEEIHQVELDRKERAFQAEQDRISRKENLNLEITAGKDLAALNNLAAGERQEKALAQEKEFADRDHLQEQKRQMLELTMHRHATESQNKLNDMIRKMNLGAPMPGGGGTMSYSPQAFQGQNMPTARVGGMGQYFTPEQQQKNTTYYRNANIKMGEMKGEVDMKKGAVMNEWGDVPWALTQYTSEVGTHFHNMLQQEELFGNELMSVLTDNFGPGGDVMSLITQHDPNRISGGAKLGQGLDAVLRVPLTGGGVVSKPLEKVEDAPLYDVWEESQGGWFSSPDTEKFNKAVQQTEVDAASSAFTILQDDYDFDDMDKFEKVYNEWASENEIRSYEMGAFGTASSNQSFNKYLAMEMADKLGLEVDQNLLANARSVVAGAGKNPLLDPDTLETWGQEEVLGFTAADPDQIKTNILNSIANNFDGRGYGTTKEQVGVGDTIRKVAPLLIAYSHGEKTQKQTDEAREQIMKVFADNDYANFNSVMQLMDHFITKKNLLSSNLMSEDNIAAIQAATGGREEDYAKAIGAIETTIDSLGDLGANFNHVVGVGRGGPVNISMVQGQLNAAVQNGLTGTTTVGPNNTTVNVLKDDWKRQMFDIVVKNGDQRVPVEAREARLATIFKVAENAELKVNKEYEEAQFAVDELSTALQAPVDYMDDVFFPWEDKQMALGQQQYVDMMDDYEATRDSADDQFYSDAMDILTGGDE